MHSLHFMAVSSPLARISTNGCKSNNVRVCNETWIELPRLCCWHGLWIWLGAILMFDHEWFEVKSLNSKTDISIFINLRYLRLKLLKNKENNKKICHIFHHNFKNINCYVMSEVSLKRFYFALFDDGLTLKTLKLAFIGFLKFKLFKCSSGTQQSALGT